MEKVKEILGELVEKEEFYFLKELLENFSNTNWEAYAISKIVDTLWATQTISLDKYCQAKDIILDFM